MANKNNSAIVALLVVITVILGYTAFIKPQSEKVNPSQSRKITLGQEFTAHKGEAFVIADSYGDMFTVTSFYNIRPCPPNAACSLPSGQQVFYQIKTVDVSGQQKGRVYNSEREEDQKIMPYLVTIKNSDYETYARVTLETIGRNQ